MPNPGISNDFKRSLLDSIIQDYTYHVVLVNFQPEYLAITNNDVSGNAFNVTNTLTNGTRIQLEGANLPTDLTSATDYFVVNASGSSFQISDTLGGDALTFSGGANFDIVEQALEPSDNRIPVAQIAKHEVLRNTTDLSETTVQDRSLGGAQTTYTPFELTANTTTAFTHYAVLYGSEDTPKSTQGNVLLIRDMGSPQQLRNAQTVTIPVRFALIQKTAGTTEDS